MNQNDPNSLWDALRALPQSPNRPPNTVAADADEEGEATPAQRETIARAIQDMRATHLVGIRDQDEFRQAITSGTSTELTLTWSHEAAGRALQVRLIPDPKVNGAWQLLADHWPAEAGELKHLYVGAFELGQFPLVSGILLPGSQVDLRSDSREVRADSRVLAADSGDDDDDAFLLPFAADSKSRSPFKTDRDNVARSLDGVNWQPDGRLFLEADVTGELDSTFAVVELSTVEVPARRLAIVICELQPPVETGRWKGQARLPAPAAVLSQSSRLTVRPLAIEDVGWLQNSGSDGLPQTTSFLGGQDYRAVRLESIAGGYRFTPFAPVFRLPEVGVCLSAVPGRKEVK